MKVLIAPNNFKESIDAAKAAKSIEKGLKNAISKIDTTCLPLSDGGEGFVKAMVNSLHGERINCKVEDPLGRQIDSYFGSLSENTAVIEMALASGLELISESEKHPLNTSSYGTGELIKEAIHRGFKNILIGIGGSATNDGGMGMLQALGVKFYDTQNRLIKERGAHALIEVKRINLTDLIKLIECCTFTVACDVTNPLLGTYGATYVYGTQKGASAADLEKLESYMTHFAHATNKAVNKDLTNSDGAGAAGGMGFGLMSYLNADLKPGFNIVADNVQLLKHINDSDLVITGEGKIDKQTSQGKVISRLAELCQNSKVPLVAIGGLIESEIEINGVSECYEISKRASSPHDSMVNAGKYLEEIGYEIGVKLKTIK